MNPPIIKNTFPKGEPFGRIPSMALPAINVILTDRERRLLLYYACQKSKFAPARETIYRYTGIPPKHLSAVRKGLDSKGFIYFTPPSKGQVGEIEIRWEDIIHRSKALLLSAQTSADFPDLNGRIYPRTKNKAPETQIISPREVDITYIYPDSALSQEPTLHQLFMNERLQALSSGREIPPDYEGYHENGADRIERLTEAQLQEYLTCDLNQYSCYDQKEHLDYDQAEYQSCKQAEYSDYDPDEELPF